MFQVVAGRVLGALRGAILLRSDLVGPMGDTQLLDWRQQTLWSIISACSEMLGARCLAVSRRCCGPGALHAVIPKALL